jgi:site-specific recombinase XerD
MAEEPKLLDQVRRAIRMKHFSRRTEEAYQLWTRRFVLYHGKRHPRDMGEAEIRAFLSHLATDQEVAASTQNQALSALLFLYRHVLEQPLPRLDLDRVPRAKRPARLPVVLTPGEVNAVLNRLGGVHGLAAALLYGYSSAFGSGSRTWTFPATSW